MRVLKFSARCVLLSMIALVALTARADGFKIVTYNVRHGAGNGPAMKIDLARQADLIRSENARFVLLQEVESGSRRTGGVDQPAEYGRLLGLHGTFAKAIDFMGGGYGVGLLSREKPLSVERLAIPDSQENRMILICEFEDCFVASTHFSVATEKDRQTALKVLRARLAKGVAKPFFIGGDLNSRPDSLILDELRKDFKVLTRTDSPTYIGGRPSGLERDNVNRCIDYILCDKAHVQAFDVESRVLGDCAADAPSDHRPVALEVKPRAAEVTVEGADGAAIQRAIDAVAADGGGRVTVPRGEYLSGSLRLRSGVELHLAKGAVIRGKTRSDDYFDFPKDVCSITPENSAKVFVYAWDAHDIAITGEGTIDGQGPEFFDRTKMRWEGRFWNKPPHPRPRMVQFVRCRNVRLEGVTFKDSPGWAMLIRLCENVTAEGIRVDSEQRMINSDGIDFDGCRHVRVRKSSFRTGDDCLIVRSMREAGSDERIVSEDIVVEDCELDSACQTVRMGCPSDDTIRNVRFRNLKCRGYNGVNFDYPVRYLRSDDEGYMDVADVVFDGYEGDFTGSALQIVVGPGVKVRNISGITLRNFKVKSARPLRFLGNADSPIRNVTLESVVAEVPGERPYEAKATEPLRFRGCVFNGRQEPDRELVTPRGARERLVRTTTSWESAKKRSKAGPVGPDPDVRPFEGGDWRADRIRRTLIPDPTAEDFARAKAEWQSFADRRAAWGPAPDLGEANAPAVVSKTQLWVAPDGDDVTGDGSRAKPFRGILRARDEVRKLKKGVLPADGITVFLRGGTYPMTETLVFGSADGGEPGCPVLYCAAPGEVPVFDGGFRVTGWTDFKGPVKVADIRSSGYVHFEPFGPRGFEVSRESTGALVSDLYLDGVRQLPAEWPNEGWRYFTCAGTNNVVGIALDDWTPWRAEKNLYAKMYPACFWADLTSPVTNLDPKAGLMSVYGRAQGKNQVIRKDCAFRFKNALAALDREGECVFDFAGGKLYAWNPAGKEAVLSDFSKTFLYFWTAHDLEFRGLVFRYGRGNAVEADKSQRLTFRDCRFLGFGQNGIMARRMESFTVDDCRFRDFGYHALRIGAGERKTLTGGRTFVQNCDISRAGNWKADFSFAACVDGCGATLRWNRFHDVPAATVRLNGNDMMLASNVFERCDYEAGDNGAVDIYANPTHASRIVHNVFRDCGSKDRGFTEAGQAGIRLDDAVSNQIVYGNRFENCSPTNEVVWGFGCIQVNGGRNNTFENNLFVGGWRAASISAWPMRSWTNYFTRGGVKAMLGEVDWKGSLYAKRYPGIDRLADLPLVNRFYRNVQVGTGRFVPLLGGQTDARCNFAYRTLPDEATLNANPLWDPLPPESALGPRTSRD